MPLTLRVLKTELEPSSQGRNLGHFLSYPVGFCWVVPWPWQCLLVSTRPPYFWHANFSSHLWPLHVSLSSPFSPFYLDLLPSSSSFSPFPCSPSESGELERLSVSPAPWVGSLHLLSPTVFSLGVFKMESNKEKDRKLGRGTMTSKSSENHIGKTVWVWEALGNINELFPFLSYGRGPPAGFFLLGVSFCVDKIYGSYEALVEKMLSDLGSSGSMCPGHNPFIPHAARGLLSNNHQDLISCLPLPPPEQFQPGGLGHRGYAECPGLFFPTAWVCQETGLASSKLHCESVRSKKAPFLRHAIESSFL